MIGYKITVHIDNERYGLKDDVVDRYVITDSAEIAIKHVCEDLERSGWIVKQIHEKLICLETV